MSLTVLYEFVLAEFIYCFFICVWSLSIVSLLAGLWCVCHSFLFAKLGASKGVSELLLCLLCYGQEFYYLLNFNRILLHYSYSLLDAMLLILRWLLALWLAVHHFCNNQSPQFIYYARNSKHVYWNPLIHSRVERVIWKLFETQNQIFTPKMEVYISLLKALFLNIITSFMQVFILITASISCYNRYHHC